MGNEALQINICADRILDMPEKNLANAGIYVSYTHK